jgi:DNA gyrase subunit A
MEELRIMGRATQGVRLINLKDGDSIAAVAKIAIEDEEIEDINEEEDTSNPDETTSNE